MKYMSTNEPDRFIIDKSMELVRGGNVMVLVPWQYHIYQLHQYAKSRIEFCGASLGTMTFSFTDNCIFFRSARFIFGLKSISVRSLIILEPVPWESRMLAIERTRASFDPEIWRVNEF